MDRMIGAHTIVGLSKLFGEFGVDALVDQVGQVGTLVVVGPLCSAKGSGPRVRIFNTGIFFIFN